VDVLGVFGRAIKSLRLEKGLTQEELAYECQLHRTYISGIEQGTRNVSLINIIKISKALKVTPSQLLKCLDNTDERVI